MRIWHTIDKHCPSCRGTGEVIASDLRRKGECWVSFSQCHCVVVHHDDEMKEFLKRILPDAVTSG